MIYSISNPTAVRYEFTITDSETNQLANLNDFVSLKVDMIDKQSGIVKHSWTADGDIPNKINILDENNGMVLIESGFVVVDKTYKMKVTAEKTSTYAESGKEPMSNYFDAEIQIIP